MRCAPRTQIPQISCYTKLLTVVKGFSEDLVSVRTSQAIRWKKLLSVRTALAIRLKKKCYPFEWLRLSVWENLSSVRTVRAIRWKKNAIHPFEGLRTTQANPFEESCHSIEQLRLSVGKIVIRSRFSGYPFEENCNPFERLELFCRSKQLSAALLFRITFTRAVRDENHVSLNNSS